MCGFGFLPPRPPDDFSILSHLIIEDPVQFIANKKLTWIVEADAMAVWLKKVERSLL